jgi:SAM-dependent methyltransferase
VLDLGCGEGRHTLLLAGAGYDAVGVDYEPLAIRRAKRIASERGMTGRCRFMVADGFRLPFPNGSFDVLVDFGCLHHIRKSDFDRYLSRVIPLLKSGGRFLLSCFSVKFKHHPGERRRRDWLVHRGHYDRFFRKDEFRKLFGAQFRIRRIEEERNGTYVFWNVLMEKV